MTFRPDHELHVRRRGRNWGLGLVLLTFAALVYGLTVVKSLEKSAPVAAGTQAGTQTEAGQ